MDCSTCWALVMVYVQRDEKGRLLRVEQVPFAGMHGALESECEELQGWLRKKLSVEATLSALKETDTDMIRVLEDLVTVLVDRGLIAFEDLPAPARKKLDERAVLRADLEGIADHGSD